MEAKSSALQRTKMSTRRLRGIERDKVKWRLAAQITNTISRGEIAAKVAAEEAQVRVKEAGYDRLF